MYLMPFALKNAYIGFKSFVNILGNNDNSKDKTINL